MSAVPTPDEPAAGMPARRLSPWMLAGALGVALAAGAGALAFALAGLIGGAGAAALAAVLAVLAAALPLCALLVKLWREVARQREQLARHAGDGSAGHRGHFLALAEREWARTRRYGGEPALLIVDVDRFQRLCETRGVDAGDAVLGALARDWGPTLRGADAYARFGGGQIECGWRRPTPPARSTWPTASANAAKRWRSRSTAPRSRSPSASAWPLCGRRTRTSRR